MHSVLLGNDIISPTTLDDGHRHWALSGRGGQQNHLVIQNGLLDPAVLDWEHGHGVDILHVLHRVGLVVVGKASPLKALLQTDLSMLC